MRGYLIAVGAAALALSACVQTKQYADVQFAPPAGAYKLLVMRPDVSVGSVTTGGKTIGLSPRQFMGYPGFQFDFDHLDTDEVWRRGRSVGAVIDGRLYFVLLDGARSHYFNAALADFEAVANSALLKR